MSLTDYPMAEAPKPETVSTVDANGVNLTHGTYSISAPPDVSIGPPGPGQLAFVRTGYGTDGWTHNHQATISQMNWGGVPPNMFSETMRKYEVRVPGYSERFTCAIGPSPAFLTGACTTDEARGGTLDFDPDSNPSTKQALYRAADGSFGVFEWTVFGGDRDPSLVDWTDAASGIVTHYTYKFEILDCIAYSGGVCISGTAKRTLLSINNSVGYQLKFVPDDITGFAEVIGINNAVEYCDPAADSCSVAATWPRATYELDFIDENPDANSFYPADYVVTTGAQDPATSRTTVYRVKFYQPDNLNPYAWMTPSPIYMPLESITLPGSTTPDITIVSDELARVTSIIRHGDGVDRTWEYEYSDSSSPYVSRDLVYFNYSFPPNPLPPLGPSAPPAGYAGSFVRTTTVTDPLSQVTTYSSSIAFRTQCNTAQWTIDGGTDQYLGHMCDTQLQDARLLSVTDPLGRTASYQWDSNGRLTRSTPPEGTSTTGYTQYTYDARGNVTEVRQRSKNYPTDADIVTAVTYPAGSTCASDPIRCNKPSSITDARGFATEFTYDATHGGTLTVTPPAPTGSAPTGSGTRPQTRRTYGTFYARYKTGSSTWSNGPPVYLPVETSVCATNAWPGCDGTSDETVTSFSYQPGVSTPSNILLLSTTSAEGDGSPSATSAFTYDDIANQLTVDGPLSGSDDTARSYYNTHREVIGVIGPDPDGGGSLLYRATRTTYLANGLPSIVEQGTTNNQNAVYATAFAVSSFNALAKTETLYNGFELAADVLVYDGSAIVALTETRYDELLRPLCTTMRMNPTSFSTQDDEQTNSGSNNACALGTAGSFGNDRITRTLYDAAGRITTIQSAYASPRQQDTRSAGYTGNGLEDWVQDANGNRTDYTYDGFNRLVRIDYPSVTNGSQAANTSDYELFTYDANGNHLTERRRDGQVFDLAYDNLNRPVHRDAPGTGSSDQPDETRAYDNLGRQVCAQTWPANAPPSTVTVGACTSGSPLQNVSAMFDGLSRQLTEVSAIGTVSYQYDAASRRTRTTWPDSYYVDYVYNTGGDLTEIRENGATSAPGRLALYTYDDLGRRTFLTRGNGTTTDWSFDGAGRLTGLVHDLASTGNDQAFSFSYTPASQLLTRTRSNAAYDWTEAGSATPAYTVNGLNQYVSVGGVSISHDSRGNMTSDGAKDYAFDFDNRLTSQPSGSVTLTYDPTSRLSAVAQGGTTTHFLYDGPDVIAEYNASGTLLRRYVHGPGMDDPLVWLEGSGTSDRRSLIADERGSVIAVTNGSGALSGSLNTYDTYGIPAGSAVNGRFGYTGQMWIPELALYHYKARVYHPRFGRFLQTDPIRYGDGMNLYAYVGNDPISAIDPSGTAAEPFCLVCKVAGRFLVIYDYVKGDPLGYPEEADPDLYDVWWEPARGGAPRGSQAAAYDDSANGAWSYVGSAQRMVPTLSRPSSHRRVAFDGIDYITNELIDRKWNVERESAVQDQALRQSEALEHNNLTARWEVPNQNVADRVTSILNGLTESHPEVGRISVTVVEPEKCARTGTHILSASNC